MKSEFAAISNHAAAVLYTGGTVAQLLKLLLNFSWVEMPFLIEWLIIVLGSVAAAGLVWFHRDVVYRGVWEQILHWMIVIHLVSSVVLHIWTLAQGNHNFYASFPYEYSYFAILYFGLFAWRSWTVRFAVREESDAVGA